MVVFLKNLLKSVDCKLHRWVKKWVTRTTILKIEIGNILIAFSTTGLMALGIIDMSLPLLLSFAFVLVVLGVVGRYIDSVKDDKERLEVYAEHLKKSSERGIDFQDSPCRDVSDDSSKS